MKKTKLYAKKTLSVFLAVMMLMSAWVFVAPTEASAATSISYPVTLTFNLANCAKGGHILIYYYPVNADGTLDTSKTDLTYTFMYSLAKYSSGDNQTFTAGDSGDNRPSGDTDKSTGNIPGWPYKVYIDTNGSWGTNANIAIKSIKIGNKTVLSSSSQWSCSNTERDFASGGTYDGIATTWPEPALDSVRTAPTAQTISVPKGSSASKTFTAYFNDQYGMQWPSSNGLTAALSPTLTGASVSLSGNTATVTGDNDVFDNSGYNSSNGQIKTTLQMTQGGKTASCDVTFQAPKYNVYLQNFAGNTVKTYSNLGYYNQSVTLTDLPANTAIAQIAGDEVYHQPYKWPDNTANAFNLDGDTTYKEEKAPVESHSWSAWTQNADNHSRTCSVCGYVQTQDHIKGTGYETKAETCTEDGVMTYDCSVCGKTAIETSFIDKITGHSFTGEIIENVTGENGSHYRKCARFEQCGTYGFGGVEYDATLGTGCEKHIWDKNGDGKVDATDATSSKASTCEKAGFETYTCKVCSATWTKTLDLAAHKTNKTAAKDATNICGGDGNEAFWTCSVCNRVWKDEALTDELTDTTDADNDRIPDALETKGPDHEFTGAYVNVKDGKDGTHYRQCSRFTQCGAYGLMVDGKAVVNATEAHKFTSTETASSCTVQGTKTYTCSDCNHSYTEKLPLAAHTMETIEAVVATCTTGGNNKYYSCTTCNKYYKDEAGTTETTVAAEKISALGHTFAEGNTDVNHPESDARVSAATCMTPAVYTVTCDRCNAASDRTYEYGDPDTVNGHKFDGTIKKNDDGTHSYKCTVEGCPDYGSATTCDYKVTKDVASTCKTAGYTTYECKDCGNGYSITKALDPNNHKGEGTYIIADQAPTCATFGSTGIEKCSGCDTVLSTKLNDIPVNPENHEAMIDYTGQAATCQTEGWKSYKYCSACGTYEIAKETIAKKAHKFTTYTTNNNGTHTATCDTCDATVATPATDTKNCTGGTANCIDKKVCDVCKAEYGEVDSATHKTVKTAPEVKATCQTEGTEAYRYCEACGKNIDEIKKLEKLPHVYDKWTSNGNGTHSKTCTLCDPVVADPDKQTKNCNGGIAYCNALAKCADCKAEYGELNPANHSTEANTLKDVVDATCQKEGFSGNYRYDCCDAIKEAGKVTEKLAHKFDIEVEGSRVAATCIAKGEVTYKCSTCVETDDVKAATEKKELPIDAKNHATPEETVTKNKKAPTCESDGHTGDVYYKCCYVEGATAEDNRKALKEKGTTIKANGQHVYGDPIPEYMIAEIKEIKDADGNVTGKEIVLKTEEPDYDAKIKARREDSKWYHAQQCTICGEIVYDACFTYTHTYNCKETDICEICEGLCSLIDENKHTNLIEIPEVPATPTTDGTKAYYKCADCGKFFLDDAGKKGFDPTSEEGKKLITISKETADCEHNWPSTPNQTVEPACGEAGYKLFVCTICGDEKKEEIPATSDSHKWSETYKVTKEPTCGSVGYEALYCTVCGKFKPNSTVTISATGKHTYKLTATHPGTSCTDPTVETYECDVCGKTKTETVYDGAAAHEWGEWVNKGGSCASGVILERSCNKCSAKEQKKEENNDHSYEVIVRVNPTCEEDGYQIEKCKNCGIENRTELPKNPDAPEHVINENKYKTVEKATCEAAEQREYVCLLCGEKVIRFVGEPIDHVWLLQPAEIATCTRPGHREYYRCVRCEQPYDDGKGEIIIEQLKHEDGDGDGKCDECNSKLYNAGESNCGCMCHKEGWLMKLIYKILNFFWKLFKINPSCGCGATHY